MANEENFGTIQVIGRATYNRRLENHEIDSNTIYFVIEEGAHSDQYLSLYVGESKQSDIVNLNQLLSFLSEQSSIELTDIFDENDIPVKDSLTPEKLYYWQDFNLNVFRAYIKSAISGEVLPLYGTPIWQTIDEE